MVSLAACVCGCRPVCGAEMTLEQHCSWITSAASPRKQAAHVNVDRRGAMVHVGASHRLVCAGYFGSSTGGRRGMFWGSRLAAAWRSTTTSLPDRGVCRSDRAAMWEFGYMASLAVCARSCGPTSRKDKDEILKS